MSVLLGYLHPQHVSASFHRSLTDLIVHDATKGFKLAQWAAIKTGSMGIPDARNMLAKQLLETDIEWLFMVDADMGFDADSLDRLMEYADPVERPIVGGLAFTKRETVSDGQNGWRWRPLPTIYMWQRHPDGKEGFTPRIHYPADSLVRCHATGGAFVLIHRSVFEKVGDEPFDRIPGKDGNMMGEDLSFFAKVGTLDIPVYVHTGIKTTHHKEVWISDVDFWQSFDAKPATEGFIIDGEYDEVSLRSTTGLMGADPYRWVLVTNGKARVHPVWYDHACFTAELYGAKVVQVGRHALVDAGWLEQHPDDWAEKARAEDVFQFAPAAVVE